jgi:hypothetical protein
MLPIMENFQAALDAAIRSLVDGMTRDARLFADALNQWLDELFAELPRPNWREELRQLLSSCDRRWGTILEEHSKRDLFDWIAIEIDRCTKGQTIDSTLETFAIKGDSVLDDVGETSINSLASTHRKLYGPAMDEVPTRAKISSPNTGDAMPWELVEIKNATRDLVNNTGTIAARLEHDADANSAIGRLASGDPTEFRDGRMNLGDFVQTEQTNDIDPISFQVPSATRNPVIADGDWTVTSRTVNGGPNFGKTGYPDFSFEVDLFFGSNLRGKGRFIYVPPAGRPGVRPVIAQDNYVQISSIYANPRTREGEFSSVSLPISTSHNLDVWDYPRRPAPFRLPDNLQARYIVNNRGSKTAPYFYMVQVDRTISWTLARELLDPRAPGSDGIVAQRLGHGNYFHGISTNSEQFRSVADQQDQAMPTGTNSFVYIFLRKNLERYVNPEHVAEARAAFQRYGFTFPEKSTTYFEGLYFNNFEHGQKRWSDTFDGTPSPLNSGDIFQPSEEPAKGGQRRLPEQ